MLLFEQLSNAKKKILALEGLMLKLSLNLKNISIMEQMTVTVKNVNVYTNGNKTTVKLTIDKMVKQFVTERDEAGNSLGLDTITEKEVAYIKLPITKLIAQLSEVSEDLMVYFAMLDHAVGKKELVLLLLGSKLKVTHELHAKDEQWGEGDDEIYHHDCYVTDAKGVDLCDRAKTYMEKFMFM